MVGALGLDIGITPTTSFIPRIPVIIYSNMNANY